MNRLPLSAVVAIAFVVVAAGGTIYYLANTGSQAHTFSPSKQIQHINTSAWRTYTDPRTGFTIQYPPQYAVAVENVASDTPWMSRSLLTIYNPETSSTYEFHVAPVHIALQKQPISVGGETYQTISAFEQHNGSKALGITSNGTLVTVNGKEALHYYSTNQDAAADAPTDSYLFIEHGLIYSITFNASDPNEQEILRSITWQ